MPKVYLTKADRDADVQRKTIQRLVKLSDHTQRDIAASLGVTAVTLGRWVKDPSTMPLRCLCQLMAITEAEPQDALDILRMN